MELSGLIEANVKKLKSDSAPSPSRLGIQQILAPAIWLLTNASETTHSVYYLGVNGQTMSRHHINL